MKISNKILTLLVCIVLMFASVSTIPSQKVNASDFIVTYPAHRQIVGAGMVSIKWNAYTGATGYDVYVDGKKVTTTTSTSYKYYTTDVKAVKTYVTANTSSGGVKTPEITFGVTKKGLGLSQNMGAKLDVKSTNIGWYYNWNDDPYTDAKYQGIEFVPMVWKETNTTNLKNRVNNAKNKGYNDVLTFNEPDLPGQCNMTVDAVYNAWQGLDGYSGDIRISSPVTAVWPSSSNWFKNFMNRISGNDYNPDFISIHCYPENMQGKTMADWFLENVVDAAWNTYHKPIWITEFSTTGQYVTANGTEEFWRNVMPGLDARPYVERYAGFGFNGNTMKKVALWYYGEGVLTPAGEIYRDLGNPDMSNVPLDNPNDKISGNNNGGSGKTGANQIAKPGKAKIKSAKYKKKKKISIKLKKITGAKGYNIRWCDNKKFDGYEGKNIKKLSYIIKGLEKNTKYFVKARAFNYDANGVKQYGKWSAVKKVKVKK